MIVGMDSGVIAELPAKNFNSTVRDHLVSVHVETDTGACLEDINHKFSVPLSLRHFLRSLNDGIGDLRVHEPKFAIGFSGGFFDHSKSADQSRMGAHS